MIAKREKIEKMIQILQTELQYERRLSSEADQTAERPTDEKYLSYAKLLLHNGKIVTLKSVIRELEGMLCGDDSQFSPLDK